MQTADCAKMEAIPEQLREFTMTRLREINLPLHRIPFQEKWVPPELPYFTRMTMGMEADLAAPADQRPVKPVIFIWMLQTVPGLAVIQR